VVCGAEFFWGFDGQGFCKRSFQGSSSACVDEYFPAVLNVAEWYAAQNFFEALKGRAFARGLFKALAQLA